MEPFCGIWGKWISFLNSCFTQSQHSVVIWFYSLIYPSVGVQSVCHFLFTQGIMFFDIVVYTGNQVFWHRCLHRESGFLTSLFTQGIRFFDIVVYTGNQVFWHRCLHRESGFLTSLFTQGIRFFDIVVYTGNQVFWHRWFSVFICVALCV